MSKLTTSVIYKDLSYKIMGILFKVHNKLGPAYQEKYYQRAIEKELKTQNILFTREFQVEIRYENEMIGKYFIDFVIENKIALEVKNVNFFHRKYLNQVLAYLSASGLKLGILVNFNQDRLFSKRIVNPRIREFA